MDDIVTKLPERIVRILQDFGEIQDDWKLKLANEITRIIRDYLPHCGLPEKDVSYTSEISRMAYIYTFLLFGIAAFQITLSEHDCTHIQAFLYCRIHR
jgi:hypothetical protein